MTNDLKIKRKYSKLKKVQFKASDLSLGSIHIKYMTCGKENCKCAKGEKHGPYYYFVYLDKESKKMKYISLTDDWATKLRERIENLDEFMGILREIMEIELKMMKEDKNF